MILTLGKVLQYLDAARTLKPEIFISALNFLPVIGLY